MKSIITKLILAGLMTLPAACATYPGQYYDSAYGYYPDQYGSSSGGYGYGGYGVVERNYYNTYSYPTPVYRIEEHHYHDGRNNRHPGNRRYQDGRSYSNSPATVNRKRGANDHYNWNTPTAKPYDNRKSEWDRQRRDNRNEGRQRRPDAPNTHGPGQRQQQNWVREESKRQNSGSGGRSFEKAEARGQFKASQDRQNKQNGQQRQRPERRQMKNQSGQ
jgi:hypothetical protein